MKKILIICLAAAMTGCGIYKPYSRPESIETDGLYGTAETADSTTIGDITWQEMFSDPQLQALIAQALENNTDLQSAQWRVKEAEATLKSARLAYLPSFNFAPQGSISSFDNANTTKTYSIPVTASWQIDIFGGITNAKRKAKALYLQSREYEQAVKTQLIASVANLYYTLLMLDSQYEVTGETARKWEETVRTMRAMKDAGMTNEAGVAQYEGSYYAIEASLHDLEYSIREAENSLCSVLGLAPQEITRGSLDNQQLPQELAVGVPVQMLSNRPDVRSAEYSLMQSFYATNAARSALYPSITLSGSAGGTHNGGCFRSRQTASFGRRIAVAADLQRRSQPGEPEDRQGPAGGGQALVPADAAQCRRRGEQRPDAMSVGPRQNRPASQTDRSPDARRGEHRTAHGAQFDDLPRSADRPAVAALGPTVADHRPFRRNPGNREPLSGSRRRS